MLPLSCLLGPSISPSSGTIVGVYTRCFTYACCVQARVSEGSQDPAVHNAVGKIYVTANKDPQQWLKTNQFYDSR